MCGHIYSKNYSLDQSAVVNQSRELSVRLERHNQYTDWVRARFGGDDRERIFILLTVISPKSSCGESICPESC